MEIKPPEYSYIWFSQEERNILRSAEDVLYKLFEEGDKLKRGEDFIIECYDSYRELEAEYAGVDIYHAYIMICRLSRYLKYYPKYGGGEEENKNEN